MTQSAIQGSWGGKLASQEYSIFPHAYPVPNTLSQTPGGRKQVKIKENNLHFKAAFSKDLKVIVDFKKHLSCRVSYCFIFSL